MSNEVGARNVAIGNNALFRSTGAGNIALGYGAGRSLTSGSNNVDIGHVGVAGESGRIRIGTAGQQTAAFLAGVTDTAIAGPATRVLVNSRGQLGTSIRAGKASTATAARPLTAGPNALSRLRHRLHRQSVALDRQQREIAQLQRLVLGGR